jgi:SH3-like domain-containing protein
MSIPGIRTLETKIWREPVDLDVTVKYVYSPAYRGARSSLGVPEEPDEEECIEICSVTDSNGDDVELLDSENNALEEKCMEDCKG